MHSVNMRPLRLIGLLAGVLLSPPLGRDADRAAAAWSHPNRSWTGCGARRRRIAQRSGVINFVPHSPHTSRARDIFQLAVDATTINLDVIGEPIVALNSRAPSRALQIWPSTARMECTRRVAADPVGHDMSVMAPADPARMTRCWAWPLFLWALAAAFLVPRPSSPGSRSS